VTWCRAGLLHAALVVVTLLAAPFAWAHEVPQPEGSVALQAGFENLSAPSVVVDVALQAQPSASPLFTPLLQGRLDLHARAAAVAGGAALQQRLTDWLFLREVVLVGPFASIVDDVAFGLRSSLLAEVGFNLGDSFAIVVGPQLTPVAALDQTVDGRIGTGLVAGARWFVVPTVAATLQVDGGYDFGGSGDGAVRGAAFAGVVVDW
jgi:hypothetical protein